MEHELPSNSSGDSAPSRVKPLEWARAAGKAEPVARAIDAYVRQRRKRRIAALAAGLAVMCALGVAWHGRLLPSQRADAVAVSTTVSLPPRETLPDGTIVELRPGAEIAVEFRAAGAGARRVTLKRGEAHFTVAKNAERPFIVAVGGVEVRAVGTAFSVEWGTREVEVLVTEGRVAVDQQATRAPAAARALSPDLTAVGLTHVDAGSRAVVMLGEAAQAARVETISPSELNERLAWRVPRLEFNGTPLGEVVMLFNRHAMPTPAGEPEPRLVLVDDELKALPLSGLLRADNLPVLLRILESSYGIKAERGANGEILLRKGR